MSEPIDDPMEDFKKLREGGNKMMVYILLAALVAFAGWWQFVRLPQDVKITKMVPGLSGGMTDLECWLTIEFTGDPPADPRDFKVVFEGEAIAGGSQTFTWDYVAAKDFTAHGKRANNTSTMPSEPPTTGDASKVNFRLMAKATVDDASYNLPLTATVYWGGVKQDSAQKSVGHAYTHASSPM